jgi:endogenous inhibitor of DNA gyrase (YacG/DUF329 family)
MNGEIVFCSNDNDERPFCCNRKKTVMAAKVTV